MRRTKFDQGAIGCAALESELFNIDPDENASSLLQSVIFVFLIININLQRLQQHVIWIVNASAQPFLTCRPENGPLS